MIENNKVIGIIPARGGSKGLPKKNILNFCGKPLIGWTIEEACKSAYIDRLIVSTDNTTIGEISKAYGCDVPFIRPKNISNDKATTDDVVMHALKTINESFEIVIILQPTSPLRTNKDIDSALVKLVKSNATSLVSMFLSDKPYEWFHRINSKGFIRSINDSKINNRQVAKNAYLPNGAIYISKVNTYREKRTFYHRNSIAYIMPKSRSIDIDDKLDFKIAEFLLNE